MNCTTASFPPHEANKRNEESGQQEREGQGKTAILVSACLLGENCKYSGGSNRNATVILWKNKLEQAGKAEFIPICPEVMGGASYSQGAGGNQRGEGDHPRWARRDSRVRSGGQESVKSGRAARLHLCCLKGEKSLLRSRGRL